MKQVRIGNYKGFCTADNGREYGTWACGYDTADGHHVYWILCEMNQDKGSRTIAYRCCSNIFDSAARALAFADTLCGGERVETDDDTVCAVRWGEKIPCGKRYTGEIRTLPSCSA